MDTALQAPLTAGSPNISEGLEGVIVAATSLSDVDGERGRLVLRGHDVERLAAHATYEDALGLLLDGALPDATRRARLRAELGASRVAAFPAIEADASLAAVPDPMVALRVALARVPAASPRDDRADAVALAGVAAVTLGAWSRRRAGVPPIAPDASQSQAADVLRMLSGAAPDAARTAALDTYFVTVSDHGLNASTFTARVVASTGAGLVPAIVAALGALEGPLHGGAPGPVLDMLDAIGAPANAEAWLTAELTAGRRIMGMGHRIYRVRDPRAAVLERAARRLDEAGSEAPRLQLARAVETVARNVLRARYPGRSLDTNVEFYTAVLLDAVGLPRALFTPAFAVGRVLGWSAHVVEQRAKGRLIRPASLYVGPAPE